MIRSLAKFIQLPTSSEKKLDALISVLPIIKRSSYLASFHTSVSNYGLEEFFDEKDNWGEMEVKVGRSWKKEELRIKSNEDLHKLWYILLKEKNMLLTMEHASKEEFQLFPNPERIDKIEDSMSNLEEVIKERNKAYWLLETGKDGERPSGWVKDFVGRDAFEKFTEFAIPKWMNKRVLETSFKTNSDVQNFLRLWREKERLLKKSIYYKQEREVFKIFQKFPHVNIEALQKKYPDLDIHKLRERKESRGNHAYNVN